MTKKTILTLAAVAAIVLFLSVALYAGSTVPTEVDLSTKIEGYTNKKGDVHFSHAKHTTDYKVACSECHHDENGKPRADLKEGDEVKTCAECHTKGGEIKGKKAKGLSDKEKLEYLGNAFHENCKTCHKKYNKQNKTKAAPTTCSKCHAKKK